MEAIKGLNKVITYEREEACSKCKGTGKKKNTNKEICSLCKGTGTYSMRRANYTMNNVCHKCNGTGNVLSDPCMYSHITS